MQPRIRLAGADIGTSAGSCHIGNKSQTYEVLFENIVGYTAFSMCRTIKLLTRLRFSSRNIHINDKTPAPQKVRSLMANINAAKSGFTADN